jgi:hypothetical protein
MTTKFDRKSVEEAVKIAKVHCELCLSRDTTRTFLALASAYLDNSLSERPMMTEIKGPFTAKYPEIMSEEDLEIALLTFDGIRPTDRTAFKRLAHALSGHIPAPELDRVEVSEAELKEIIKRLNNSSDDNFNISMYEIDRLAHALSTHFNKPVMDECPECRNWEQPYYCKISVSGERRCYKVDSACKDFKPKGTGKAKPKEEGK